MVAVKVLKGLWRDRKVGKRGRRWEKGRKWKSGRRVNK